MAELFSEKNESYYLTEKEQTLIENFRILDEEKSDALLLFSDILKK